MKKRKITIYRKNNFMINVRPLKVYVDNEFIDYITIGEKEKTIEVKEDSLKLRVDVNKSNSNTIDLKNVFGDDKQSDFFVTSQIQNGLFIFIFLTFFGGLSLKLIGFLDNPYLLLALILPFSIIVYWQTIGKKNYLMLSRKNN